MVPGRAEQAGWMGGHLTLQQRGPEHVKGLRRVALELDMRHLQTGELSESERWNLLNVSFCPLRMLSIVIWNHS